MNNYYLFSWIANLGVVPLLRSFAFLAAPPFLVLRSLLVQVALVRETIFFLLNRFLDLLPLSKQSVKILLLLPIICLSAEGPEIHNLILSHGEHQLIQEKQVKKFTLSNHDVVSHKFSPSSHSFLIKGKKLGFAELIVWRQKQRAIYRIYVMSKQKHLKILHLAQSVRSIGLDSSFAGPIIAISGTLNDFNSYLFIKNLIKNNTEHLHVRGELSAQLRNQLIGEVYKLLFEEYVDNIRCFSSYFNLYCQYPDSNPPSDNLKKYLEEHYYVQFISIKDQINFQNFRLKMKLVQLEQLSGQEINLGLAQLSGSLGELFDDGLEGLLAKNQIILANKKIDISTLAQPEIIMRTEIPAQVQIGAEIPYSQSNAQMISTEWKFAGLKIDLALKKVGKSLQLTYQTEFTRPEGDGNIVGNKESSSAMINLNTPIEIFQIAFKTIGKEVNSMPLLGSIPILGELFKSKSDQINYKKISGIILLEQHE